MVVHKCMDCGSYTEDAVPVYDEYTPDLLGYRCRDCDEKYSQDMDSFYRGD